MLSPIKYTGAKRIQAPFILEKIPLFTGTYYEPFIGGGSVLLEFLSVNENYPCVASDINEIVIDSWNLIKKNPIQLLKDYTECYERVERNEEDYYAIRNEFNQDKKDVAKFIFMARCAINGLIRFSKSGNFNSPKNPARKNAMKPEGFEKILFSASRLIQNTTFKISSYENILPKENDFIYFDPPYTNSNGMYLGNIDLETYWKYMRSLKCKWLLSFDGKINGDEVVSIPIPYKNRWFVSGKQSKFKKIASNKGKRIVEEALYSNF